MLYSFKKVIKRREEDIGIILIHEPFQIKLVHIRNFENFKNLKMLLALDVLLLKVMYFTIRFCSTCIGQITVLYARPQSIMQYCKCEWKRLK